MPHVREGELHAYLDGALDRLGPDVAARVRDHLERCDDCQNRVDQERDLREHASALLERALPREIVPPPFEELRRRAEVGGGSAGAEQVPSKAGTSFQPWKWAWAASLVLALGTGWMMGGGSLDFRNFETRPAASDVAVQADEMFEAEALEPEAESPGADAFRTSGERPVQAGQTRAAPSDDVDSEAPASAPPPAVAEERTDRNEMAAVSADPERDSTEARRQAVTQRRVAPAEVAESVAPPPPTEAVPLLDQVTATGAGVPSQSRDVASDGAPLLIPTASLLAVLEGELGQDGRGLLQQLPEGDSVLLVWTGDDQVDARVMELEARLGAERLEADLLGADSAAVGQARLADPAREKVAAGQAEDIAASAFSLGRVEPWPSVVRIRRGAALLTVYGTRSEEELRDVLRGAGLLPSP